MLVNAGGSYRLVAVNLTNLQVVNTLPIAGQATGVAIGPNGLIYVGATNQVLEIDPTPMVDPQHDLGEWRAGKALVHSEWQSRAGAQSDTDHRIAIMIFNLICQDALDRHFHGRHSGQRHAERCFSGQQRPRLRVFANALTLYDVSLSALDRQHLSVFTWRIGDRGRYQQRHWQVGSHAITQYLFYTAGNILYEFDLSANLVVGQLAFTGTGGSISVATPANIAGIPAAIVTYGDQQNVALAGTTAPLVLRVVDSQGNPVAGVSCDFCLHRHRRELKDHHRHHQQRWLGFHHCDRAQLIRIGHRLGHHEWGPQHGVHHQCRHREFGGGGGEHAHGRPDHRGRPGVAHREATSTLSTNSTMTVKFADVNGKPLAGATITFALTQATAPCSVR